MNQNMMVLGYLSTGRKLTPLKALEKLGIFRLSARCFDLRQMGHDITSKLVTRNGKHFSEYSLNKK